MERITITRLARFLKRHILLVGLLAVGAPLLVMLVMQYQSLTSLEKKSRLANDLLLRSYLEAVATEISDSYLIKSEQSLNLPPQLLKNQSALAEHFEKVRWDGARTYFVAAFAADGNAQTTFYSSTQGKAAELPAVNEAIAAWKLRFREQTSLDPTSLEVDERDTDNRIIFKPILDRASKLAGVSGLIVDNSNFKEKYLPAAIQKLRSNYFSADYQEYVIVMVFDKNDSLVLASQPVQGHDEGVVVPLRFIFTDWRMRIRNPAMSHQQWTRHAFTISLSLSVLMTIGILASIIFGFRAASREIRLSQMKSDFIANISHELKTPLTSIRTFGELLQAGWISDPQQVRESGASIESESRRLTQLVDNILDLSQIESRQRRFHFEETDLGEVVADTLKTLEPRLRQKGFQVVCQQLSAPLPPVRLDREAIAQVLTNLIDNAAKYSGQHKRIVLNLEALNGRVAVSVRDYGIGIPSTEKERIFERFHRANTGFLHDVRGSGIGLSIVKNIVEAHGGRVSVESTAGAGSVFTVSFPIAENDSGSSGANGPKGRPR